MKWSRSEELALQQAVENGLTPEEMAELFNRSKDAIRCKLRRGEKDRNYFWSEREEAYLLKYKEDETWSELARKLNKTKSAVRNKYRRLMDKIE